MKSVILTKKDFSKLPQIQKKLNNPQLLIPEDFETLGRLLSQITSRPPIIPAFDTISIPIPNTMELERVLKKWARLFKNIPGYDYAGDWWIIPREEKKLLSQGVIATLTFAPTMAYNETSIDGCEVHLKNNGTAKFWFPTFEDAEQYPELYNFKGSWKEAYYLLIETLKKGWPMEEFPEELLPLLKK